MAQATVVYPHRGILFGRKKFGVPEGVFMNMYIHVHKYIYIYIYTINLLFSCAILLIGRHELRRFV